MKKISKVSLHFIHLLFEAIIAFISVYFSYMILGMIIPTGQLFDKGDTVVYVKGNGVHTDVCLPVNALNENWLEFVSTSHYPSVEHPKFIRIGWGDKGFFLDTPTWDDLTFSTAFNAAFLKSGTAMHVEYEGEQPITGELCRKLILPESNYHSLCKFIQNSFLTVKGKPILIPEKGYWETDNFYEANGNYNLFNTCNTWTNNALKAAGVKTGVHVLFQNGILHHLPKN